MAIDHDQTAIVRMHAGELAGKPRREEPEADRQPAVIELQLPNGVRIRFDKSAEDPD